jgi:hypothetical protein
MHFYGRFIVKSKSNPSSGKQVSFIDGGNWFTLRKPCTILPNVTDKGWGYGV